MKIIDMKSYQERNIAYKECLKSLQNGENPITRHELENRMREEDKSQKKTPEPKITERMYPKHKNPLPYYKTEGVCDKM